MLKQISVLVVLFVCVVFGGVPSRDEVGKVNLMQMQPHCVLCGQLFSFLTNNVTEEKLEAVLTMYCAFSQKCSKSAQLNMKNAIMAGIKQTGSFCSLLACDNTRKPPQQVVCDALGDFETEMSSWPQETQVLCMQAPEWIRPTCMEFFNFEMPPFMKMMDAVMAFLDVNFGCERGTPTTCKLLTFTWDCTGCPSKQTLFT